MRYLNGNYKFYRQNLHYARWEWSRDRIMQLLYVLHYILDKFIESHPHLPEKLAISLPKLNLSLASNNLSKSANLSTVNLCTRNLKTHTSTMAMSERSPALTYLYITFYSRAQRFYVLRRTRCTLCAVRREIVVLAHVYHFQFRLKYYRNFLIYIALDLLLQIWCRLMDEIFRLTLQQRWKLAVTKVANWQKKKQQEEEKQRRSSITETLLSCTV